MKWLMRLLFPCSEVAYTSYSISVTSEVAMRRLHEAAERDRGSWDRWSDLSRLNGVT